MGDFWKDDFMPTAAWHAGLKKARGGGRGKGFENFMSGFADSAGQNIQRDVKNVGNYLGMGDGAGSSPYQMDPNATKIPGYDDWQAKLAAGGGGLDTGPQSQVRAQQAELSQMLMDQAMGRGPSVAQMQLQQATDRNMAQALSLSAAQGAGGRGAGGMRQVGTQRAQIGQQQAMDSGILRAQEMMQGRGLAAQQQQGMRAGDLDVEKLKQFYVSQGLDLSKAQMAANLEMQKQASENWNAIYARRGGMVSGIAGALLS